MLLLKIFRGGNEGRTGKHQNFSSLIASLFLRFIPFDTRIIIMTGLFYIKARRENVFFF